MKAFYVTALFFFAFSKILHSQVDFDSLALLHAEKYPQEKLHLHLDKDSYFPSETIWVKAYLFSNGVPSTISTNLYIDLLDSKGNTLIHKAMPIINASADSYFTLPDTCSNFYIIRAYTNWMLNFDTSFIFKRVIHVYNKNSTVVKKGSEVSLQFFPEGGNYVNDLYNYVAFKANMSNGEPFNLKAVLKNNKDEIIDSINSLHNGMGVIKFTPFQNENYFVDWRDEKGDNRRTHLPDAKPKGIVFHVEQINDDIFYLINSNTSEDGLQEATVLCTQNQKIVYKAKIKSRQSLITQKINSANFEAGILQLTILDKKNIPVAERILFIKNNFSFSANIIDREKGLSKRAKNYFEIEMPDTVHCDLSLSVVDAAIDCKKSENSIFNDLLLQGDLKGYVYNPNYYFENNTLESNKHLDLVMLTNGWRRYNWDNVINHNEFITAYPKDNFLNIYGKVVDVENNPILNKTINLIVQSKDSLKTWYFPITNADGTFIQKSLLFYDTATVFYKLNDDEGKISRIGIANNYNGLLQHYPFNGKTQFHQINLSALVLKVSSETNDFFTPLEKLQPEFVKKEKLLNEVVVSSNLRKQFWKNDPIIKMNEKYTNMFKGLGSGVWTFDVLHDEFAASKFDIYNYLYGKIPGFGISGNKSFGAAKIFLDEFEIDNQTLQNINLEEIAFIKYYEKTPWVQFLLPSLCIYLKKADDKEQNTKNSLSKLSKIKIPGYSPIKEFYEPDYSQSNIAISSDTRTTLLWRPYIFTGGANTKIPITFYNNDFTKRFRIVLEGINDEGKMIHIEKIIEQ